MQTTPKITPNRRRDLQSRAPFPPNLDFPRRMLLREGEWAAEERIDTIRVLLVFCPLETCSHYIALAALKPFADQATLISQSLSLPHARTEGMYWSLGVTSAGFLSSAFLPRWFFPSRDQASHWMNMLNSLWALIFFLDHWPIQIAPSGHTGSCYGLDLKHNPPFPKFMWWRLAAPPPHRWHCLGRLRKTEEVEPSLGQDDTGSVLPVLRCPRFSRLLVYRSEHAFTACSCYCADCLTTGSSRNGTKGFGLNLLKPQTHTRLTSL